jgi:hypothetical protein
VITDNSYHFESDGRISRETLLTPKSIIHEHAIILMDSMRVTIRTPLKSRNRTKGTRDTPFSSEANAHPTEEGDVEKNAYL